MSLIVSCGFWRPARMGISFRGDTRNGTAPLCQEFPGGTPEGKAVEARNTIAAVFASMAAAITNR